jgi:hypothetical protein
VDASPDFVEIVIVAQDLASAKVNQVADRVEGRLKKMSATASASGSGFTNLGRSIEDAGIKGDQLAINFDNLEHHTGQLSLGFKELEYEMTKESRAATQSHSTHQTLLGGILRLITAGGAWVDHLARSTTATITHSNAVRRITNDFQRFEAVARRAIRPVEEWASRAVMAAQSAIGWSRANLDLAGNFGKIGTALGSINPLMLKFVGLAALISFAVVGVSGAIVALTGAVTALASALSTLSALAVTIPAAFAAIGGAAAAVLGIIKPAVGGITQYIQEQGKAQGQAAGGSSAGSDQARQVADAERSLYRTRRDAVQQIADLERRLSQERAQAARDNRDAEQQLADARVQAVNRVIDAEQRLQALLTANQAERDQLLKNLADAQATLAAEQARGGAGTAIAAANVGEAQGDLQRFNAASAVDEAAAARDLATAQRDGIRGIQDAEQNLADVRRRNAIQIANLERDLARQRVQNRERIADAERALAQAEKGTGDAATGSASAAQAAYAKLTPMQQKVADLILLMKDRWHALTLEFQNRFLGELLKDLQGINSDLPQIANIVGGFSDVIVRAMARVRTSFSDPQFRHAIVDVAMASQHWLDLAADAGTAFGRSIVYILQVARPFLDWLGQTVDGWAHYIENVTKSRSGHESLTRFFDHAMQVMKVLGPTIRDFAIAIFNIGKAGFGGGVGILQDFRDLAKAARDFTESTGGQSQIKSFFADSLPVARELARLVGAIFGDLAGIGRDAIRGGDQSPLAGFARELRTGLLPFLDKLLRNLTGPNGLGPLLVKVAQDAGPVIAAFVGPAGPLHVMLQLLDLMLQAFNLLPGPVKTFVAILVSWFLFMPKFNLLLSGLFGILRPLIVVLYQVGAAVWAAFGPWSLVILAAIAIGYLIYRNWDTISKYLVAIWNWLKDKVVAIFGAIKDFISDHWRAIVILLSGGVGALVVLIVDHWDWLKDKTQAAFFWLRDNVFEPVAGWLKRYLINPIGDAVSAIGGIWDRLRDVAQGKWDLFLRALASDVNILIDGINWILSHIGSDTHIGRVSWGTGAGKSIGTGGHASGGVAQFATGGIPGQGDSGIYQPVPGGVYRFVEAGAPEAIISLDPKYRARSLQIVAEVLRRLGFDPELFGERLFAQIAMARAVAQDLLPDSSIANFAAGGITSKSSDLERLVGGLREAVRIDRMNLPYVWGGGHQSSPAPDNGPFDCSGFVSHILQHMGFDIPTMVASQFKSFGTAGSSKWLEVDANTGHVYMGLFGRYFGTSTYNPGGGPGLLPYGHRSGFSIRDGGLNPLNFAASDSLLNAITSGAGRVWAAGNQAFSNIADVVGWIKDHLPSFPSYGKFGGLFGSLGDAAGDALRNQAIDWLKGKVPFFAAGGEVGAARTGRPVPIVAHEGEWVVNGEQQLRLAYAFGGLARARNYLFRSGLTPTPGYSFAAGGIVGAPPGLAGMMRPAVNQHFEINTASPQVDIDYVMAVAEHAAERLP